MNTLTYIALRFEEGRSNNGTKALAPSWVMRARLFSGVYANWLGAATRTTSRRASYYQTAPTRTRRRSARMLMRVQMASLRVFGPMRMQIASLRVLGPMRKQIAGHRVLGPMRAQANPHLDHALRSLRRILEMSNLYPQRGGAQGLIGARGQRPWIHCQGTRRSSSETSGPRLPASPLANVRF